MSFDFKQLFLAIFCCIFKTKGTLLLNKIQIFAPTLYTEADFEDFFMIILIVGYAEVF